MESSGAVFTRQNPFPPAPPIEKTHYHPSRVQNLSKKKRKTTLSPVHLNQPAGTPLQKTPLSPEDLHLSKPNFPPTSNATTVDETRFSESWPSTDLESSPTISTSSLNSETPKLSASAIGSDRQQQDSVLAKYIDRFRHGRPQSREKRQQITSAVGEDQEPFWWMSPPLLPSSSTPTRSKAKDDTLPLKVDAHTALSPVGKYRSSSTPSLCGELLDVSALALSDTSQGELNDSEILYLQEKAHRLLQKSECPVGSGSIPISSEGLGCSDFSSPVSVDEPARRPSVPSLMESTMDAVNPISLYAGLSFVPHTRPEEDILFQWRLRRKMEQARQWPQSHYQQGPQPPELSQTAPSSFIAATKPETKDQGNPCPRVAALAIPPPPISSPIVSNPQTDFAVPSHMHLLCDILTCPGQSSSYAAREKREMRLDGSRTNPARSRAQGAPGSSLDSFPEEATNGSPALPTSCASPEKQWPPQHRRAERKCKGKVLPKEDKTDKGTGISDRRQKKPTRHQMEGKLADRHSHSNRSSSHHSAHRQKVASCPEQSSNREPDLRMRCHSEHSGSHAPLSSPIHSALGQVVSEVLFPTLDRGDSTYVSSDTSQYTPAASSQSPVPLSNAQKPLEVISQLLQDAEDSDENEFADDPLLQVLRKQRKWVKEQLSEVDSVLGEFQEE